jgi:hypothetical protein
VSLPPHAKRGRHLVALKTGTSAEQIGRPAVFSIPVRHCTYARIFVVTYVKNVNGGDHALRLRSPWAWAPAWRSDRATNISRILTRRPLSVPVSHPSIPTQPGSQTGPGVLHGRRRATRAGKKIRGQASGTTWGDRCHCPLHGDLRAAS